uniref:Cyclin-dependent kinase inhibitor domain-containing protein n=1 Tax=Anopheles dirus TaxID=7168 RepID=A0A182NPI6_9DIPT
MGAKVYSHTIERLHYSPAPTPIKSYQRVTPAKSLLNRTKRNLFGSVESESAKQFVETHIRQVNEAKRKRWNYDFVKDQPTDGPLQWELVNPRPMVTLTSAAHVVPQRRFDILRRSTSSSSDHDAGVFSADELMDERADRANRSVDDESSSVSSLSEPEEPETVVQTYPILPRSPTPPTKAKTTTATTTTTRGRTLRQPQITEKSTV